MAMSPWLTRGSGTPPPPPSQFTSAFGNAPDPSPANPDAEIHDYLLQLDTLRGHCEKTGDFAKAQQCVNRMREVNMRYAKRIEALSHNSNVEAKARIAEEHKLELLNFSRMWEDKLAEYDERAKMVIDELKIKHTEDYVQQEGILKMQLMNKRPRFSKRVVELRDVLERMIQQRKYLEAEEVKKKLVALERLEIDSFDDSLAVTFEKRTQTLKQQYTAELHAVEQKVKIGREELLTQRRIDFEKLLRRHANVMREIDQQTKLHIGKTRQYVLRQVKALVMDPVKTGMDLRGVAKTVRDGQGRSAPYSARGRMGGGAVSPRVATPSSRRVATPSTGMHQSGSQHRGLAAPHSGYEAADEMRFGY